MTAMPWCAAHSQRIGIPRRWQDSAPGKPPDPTQPAGAGSDRLGQVAFTRPGRVGSAPVARYRLR